jgi:hypothetical protein
MGVKYNTKQAKNRSGPVAIATGLLGSGHSIFDKYCAFSLTNKGLSPYYLSKTASDL